MTREQALKEMQKSLDAYVKKAMQDIQNSLNKENKQ